MQIIKATEDGLCCPADASDHIGNSWQVLTVLFDDIQVAEIITVPLTG